MLDKKDQFFVIKKYQKKVLVTCFLNFRRRSPLMTTNHVSCRRKLPGAKSIGAGVYSTMLCYAYVGSNRCQLGKLTLNSCLALIPDNESFSVGQPTLRMLPLLLLLLQPPWFHSHSQTHLVSFGSVFIEKSKQRKICKRNLIVVVTIFSSLSTNYNWRSVMKCSNKMNWNGRISNVSWIQR